MLMHSEGKKYLYVLFNSFSVNFLFNTLLVTYAF